MTLVVFQFIRQLTLVAKSCIIQERNTRNPVAMFQFSITLNVVLPTCKVPHEVSPIHEVALVGEEELDILKLVRNLHQDILATAVIRHFCTFYAAHPFLVRLCMTSIIHSWEEHVLGIFVLVLMAHDEVRILFVSRSFLLALPNGSSLFHDGATHVAFLFKFHLRSKSLSVEEWTVAILVTAKIITQSKDILWRVLVHRWVSRRANHD